jgi:acyl-CoA synthetase (AMP-forming)/AMP-acid ligase II
VNIALLLEMVAEGDPDRVVVGRTPDGVGAAELLERARRVAGFLVERGVKHVGYAGLNSEVLPLALFGAAMAGLPFVPLNYRSTDDQLERALGRISPSMVIVDDESGPRLVACGAGDLITQSELVEVATREADVTALPTVSADDVAIMLFTSGTTGEPKAAILRHRHLVSYIFGSVEFLGCDPSEAQLVSVPPYHIAGVSAVLSSLYSGRRIVYLAAFDPEAWVRTAIDQGVTHAMVVPTMLGRILTHLETNEVAIPTLRHLSYGGGRMPADLIERALRALPQVDFVNAYGLTETSSTIAMLTPDDHREAFASADAAVRARLASVGRPLPALEVEIRDADGAAVAHGSRGEIWVRGDQVAGEYVGQAGDESDGWFRTKDAGYFDHEGYLFVEGRLDDVIVRGGENISPGEVEDVIARHPAVTDVAVIGVPDPEWGEAIAAVVVLAPDQPCTETDVQEWVRQHLRSNKVPSLVRFSDELPYNSTGKLLRRVLRDEIGADGQSR